MIMLCLFVLDCVYIVFMNVFVVFTLCLFISQSVYAVFVKLSSINVMYLSYVSPISYVSYVSPIFSVWGV